jgi:hypothetical protein
VHIKLNAEQGAFKSAAAFHLGSFLGWNNKIIAAAMLGSQAELLTGQYCITGKSILGKPWYGSYAISYNISSRCWEIPCIRFKGTGPYERILVELTRKDRLLMHSKAVYEHANTIIPPFKPWSNSSKTIRTDSYLQSAT